MSKNDDWIDPPNTYTVRDDYRPLLYQADGTPLRRQMGFVMQTTGTFPALSDNTSRKPPKKGGKKR